MEKQTQEKQGSVILAMIMMIGMILFQITDLTEKNVSDISTNETSIQANILSNSDLKVVNTISEKDADKANLELEKPEELSLRVTVTEEPKSLAKVESRKIKLNGVSTFDNKRVLAKKLVVTVDTIPDDERWEDFARDMKRMEEEMARVLEGQEEKLEEMNEILSEFNEEWADQMIDFHEDFKVDIDMDFGDLEEIGERFEDIQIELSEIQMDIDHDIMSRIHEEMETHHEYLREIEERMEDEEMRWKEEEEKWRAEERKWKEEERRYRDFEEELKRELVKDGLIGSEDDALKFKYDDSDINVNGEALDKNQETKYRDLLNKYNMKGKGSIMWN